MTITHTRTEYYNEIDPYIYPDDSRLILIDSDFNDDPFYFDPIDNTIGQFDHTRSRWDIFFYGMELPPIQGPKILIEESNEIPF